MTAVELEKHIQESRESLAKMRFLHGTSQLESTGLLRTTKRDIARMLTILHQKQAAAKQNQPAQ